MSNADKTRENVERLFDVFDEAGQKAGVNVLEVYLAVHLFLMHVEDSMSAAERRKPRQDMREFQDYEDAPAVFS